MNAVINRNLIKSAQVALENRFYTRFTDYQILWQFEEFRKQILSFSHKH